MVESNESDSLSGVDVPVDELKGALADKDVQIAAGHYAQLSKSVKSYARNMGGKSLARVVVALADFPFADSYPKFRSDSEQKLFTFMLSIGQAKSVISRALEADQASIQHAAVDGIVNEIQEEKQTQTEGAL
jgi:hypothetical protein